MNELIAVETRLDAAGSLRPQSFVWRGQRHVVRSHGRRWERAGQLHFLVQDERQRTFELALEPQGGRWTLQRGPAEFGPRQRKRSA